MLKIFDRESSILSPINPGDGFYSLSEKSEQPKFPEDAYKVKNLLSEPKTYQSLVDKLQRSGSLEALAGLFLMNRLPESIHLEAFERSCWEWERELSRLDTLDAKFSLIFMRRFSDVAGLKSASIDFIKEYVENNLLYFPTLTHVSPAKRAFAQYHISRTYVNHSHSLYAASDFDAASEVLVTDPKDYTISMSNLPIQIAALAFLKSEKHPRYERFANNPAFWSMCETLIVLESFNFQPFNTHILEALNYLLEDPKDVSSRIGFAQSAPPEAPIYR